MIGDNLTSLFLSNPAAAQAIRRQQMGMQLASAGTSGEPIRSHSQGLNRMAQALLGVLAMNKSDDEFKGMKEDADRNLSTWNERTAQLMGGGGGQQPAPMQQTPQLSSGGAPMGGGGVLDRIHMTESKGSMQPGVYGDNGAAAGPMQVHAAALADVNKMWGTNYTHEQLAADPALGKKVGDAYFNMLLPQFGGDERKTAAAYNAGLGRVKAAIAAHGPEWEKGIPDRTRNEYLPSVFPTNQQPQAAPPQAPSPTDAALAQARQMAAAATQAANHPDPRIRAQAPMLMQRAGQMESRALAEQNRIETRAQKVPQTITMQDPDGKGVGIYEMTPNGPGRRMGAAPKQPGESGGPFAGTGMDQQAANILLQVGPAIANGTATPEQQNQYALAYQHVEQGKVSMIPDPTDPTGQRQVMARIPGNVPPQFPRPGGGQPAPGPDQTGGAAPAGPPGQTGAPQVIQGTQTSTISAGDRSTLRKAETEAASIISSLDRFLDTRGKASVGERGASALGIPTELNTTFNAAALMAKGEALFNLGVLNGPDLDIIRRTLADPATFGGAIASQGTVTKQVGVIKDLIQSRLDAARKNFGGQPATEEKPPSPADKLPPGFKVIQ